LRAFFDFLKEMLGRPDDVADQNLKNVSKELRKMVDKFQNDFQGHFSRFNALKAQENTIK
jgi:hypothetical protein